MSKDDFIDYCEARFTKTKNPPLPENHYVNIYNVLLLKHHDYWLQRRFPLAVELDAGKLYDFYNSPLMQALD